MAPASSPGQSLGKPLTQALCSTGCVHVARGMPLQPRVPVDTLHPIYRDARAHTTCVRPLHAQTNEWLAALKLIQLVRRALGCNLALAVVLAESLPGAALLCVGGKTPCRCPGPPGAPPARPRLAAAGRSPPRSAC